MTQAAIAKRTEDVRNMQAMVAATQKSVIIELSREALKQMKDNNYRLCFAKKVAEGDYNVVWQSYNDYLASNIFSWTPQFQLFGTNTFKPNIQVVAATNKQTVGLGETCVLSKSGDLGSATTGGPETSITLVNNYGSIHPGVSQLSASSDGTLISTPIYVAPDAMVKGNAILTPVEKVLVWFEQNIKTSTMFSDARSNSVEIDLTFNNSATRLYSNQEWSTPDNK